MYRFVYYTHTRVNTNGFIEDSDGDSDSDSDGRR
jgi:hypothetical protein